MLIITVHRVYNMFSIYKQPSSIDDNSSITTIYSIDNNSNTGR